MNVRQRMLASVGVLVMTVSVACTTSPDDNGAARPPTVRFVAAEHDFGRVRQGSVVKHTYEFDNVGNLELHVTEVRASCDCTAGVTSPSTVAASASGAIGVTFDTSRSFGELRRTITVFSNDPEQPVTLLTLRGVVDLEVAVDPPSLYLGRLHRGKTAPQKARIVTRDTGGIRVQVAALDGDVLQARIVGDELRFTARPDAPDGAFEEVVHLRTNSARLPEIDVPVAGFIEAAPTP